MDKCIQVLPSAGSGTTQLVAMIAILLGVGIVSLRASRHNSGRLMAVGLPIISVLSFSAPSTQTNDNCLPTSTTSTTTVAPETTTTVPDVTTTSTVAPSCSVTSELKFQGDPQVTYLPETNSYIVSNGEWEDIPNCTNTFTYKWQYTLLFPDPVPENSWSDYVGLTSNSTTYDYLYNNGDDDCVTFARALVTATNESGLTVTVPAGPVIELCS